MDKPVFNNRKNEAIAIVLQNLFLRLFERLIMYAVTLIAPPSSGILKPNLVNNLCNAWGASNYVFLAHEEAAEFLIPSMPEDQWSMWSKFQNFKIDLVIQEENARKKSILLADMDSTMIQQECIDELASEIGIGEQVKFITAEAMNGRLDFEEALIERVSLLDGLHTKVIDKVLKERITYMPGALTLLATMKKNGCYAALVSGGFSIFTKKVSAYLGFDEHHANVLLTSKHKLTGKVKTPILGGKAKVEQLKRIARKLKQSTKQVIAVGDGANDLDMLSEAGTGVALHAKPSVADQCDIRINFGDLTSLLFIQGFHKKNFIL
jgi:phosphoserine phosphatase